MREGLLHFAIFHAIAIVILLGWSGLRLRSIALMQTFGSTPRPWFRRRQSVAPTDAIAPRPVRSKPRRSIERPEIGDSPILWKEVFIDGGLRFGLFARGVVWSLVISSFVPIGFIAWNTLLFATSRRGSSPMMSQRWENFADEMNIYARAVGAGVASLILIGVAIRGAGSILGERDRKSVV